MNVCFVSGKTNVLDVAQRSVDHGISEAVGHFESERVSGIGTSTASWMSEGRAREYGRICRHVGLLGGGDCSGHVAERG